mgnify:CR=1 FL=1
MLWIIELVVSLAFVGVLAYSLALFIMAVLVYGSMLEFAWDMLG